VSEDQEERKKREEHEQRIYRRIERIVMFADSVASTKPIDKPLYSRVLGRITREIEAAQRLLLPQQKIATLADSLAGATPTDKRSYERLLQGITDELGVVRMLLHPVARERFDVRARVWMRGQATQGYQLPIAGVPLVPAWRQQENAGAKSKTGS
jgi:hypothetical protein